MKVDTLRIYSRYPIDNSIHYDMYLRTKHIIFLTLQIDENPSELLSSRFFFLARNMLSN